MSQIVGLAAAEVITDRNTGEIILPAKEIDPDSLARRGKINIAVPNINHRSCQSAVVSRPLVCRSRLRCESNLGPPIRLIRLEHPEQDDTRRVLPFLQRRRRLGKRCPWAEGIEHESCNRADAAGPATRQEIQVRRSTAGGAHCGHSTGAAAMVSRSSSVSSCVLLRKARTYGMSCRTRSMASASAQAASASSS